MRSSFYLLLTLAAATCPAQTPASVWPFPFGPAEPLAGKPVTGQPYSGDRMKDEGLGERRHSFLQDREYRDSSGRTRLESPHVQPDRNADWLDIITIIDPVACRKYVLDVANKVAHRQVIPPQPKMMPRPGSGPATFPVNIDSPYGMSTSNGSFPGDSRPPEPPGLQGKKLGKRIIEDLPVEGVRYDRGLGRLGMINPRSQQQTTVTAPSFDEIWRSPELKITVLSIMHAGPLENTERSIHITRTEPDPSLFQLPPDYQVVDETGGFVIIVPIR